VRKIAKKQKKVDLLERSDIERAEVIEKQVIQVINENGENC